MNLKSSVRNLIYPPGATPLRWKEMSVLLLSLIGAAMTISMLFPFLPAMVKAFGESDQEAGYSAGLIASAMFLGRTVSSYFWGWLSDKIGRRPVILCSLLLMSVSTVLFGFSESVTWAIVSRFFVGLSNGVLGTAKTVISEVCDDTNQALGVTMVTIAWTTGLVLGPALGGYMAEPGLKYPSVFPEGSLFYRFAYLMPNLMNAVFLVVADVSVYFGLRETLKRRKKERNVDEVEELVNMDDSSKKVATTTTCEDKDNKTQTTDHCQITHDESCTEKEVEDGKIMNGTIKSLSKESLHRNVSKDKDSSSDVVSANTSEENDTRTSSTNLQCEVSKMESEGETSSGQIKSELDHESVETEESKLDHESVETEESKLVHDSLETECSSKLDHESSSESREEVEDSCNDNSANETEKALVNSSLTCEKSPPTSQMNGSLLSRETKKKRSGCCSGLRQSNFTRILRSRNAVVSIMTYSLYSFAVVGSDELFNLWVATQPSSGGLGFSTNQIGAVLLIIGVVLTFLQPTVLPKIERKVGAIRTFQIFATIVMFCSVCLPCLRVAYNQPTVLWTCLLVLVLPLRMATTGGFLATFILINNSVTSDMLGTVNGLAMSSTSAFRTLAPTVGGSLYAWSISSGYKIGFPFNVNLAFIFFGLTLLISIALSCILSESLNKQKVTKEVRAVRTKTNGKKETTV